MLSFLHIFPEKQEIHSYNMNKTRVPAFRTFNWKDRCYRTAKVWHDYTTNKTEFLEKQPVSTPTVYKVEAFVEAAHFMQRISRRRKHGIHWSSSADFCASGITHLWGRCEYCYEKLCNVIQLLNRQQWFFFIHSMLTDIVKFFFVKALAGLKGWLQARTVLFCLNRI